MKMLKVGCMVLVGINLFSTLSAKNKQQILLTNTTGKDLHVRLTWLADSWLSWPYRTSEYEIAENEENVLIKSPVSGYTLDTLEVTTMAHAQNKKYVHVAQHALDSTRLINSLQEDYHEGRKQTNDKIDLASGLLDAGMFVADIGNTVKIIARSNYTFFVIERDSYNKKSKLTGTALLKIKQYRDMKHYEQEILKIDAKNLGKKHEKTFKEVNHTKLEGLTKEELIARLEERY